MVEYGEMVRDWLYTDVVGQDVNFDLAVSEQGPIVPPIVLPIVLSIVLSIVVTNYMLIPICSCK